MQILSYNLENDEFFVGLSLEEFEQLSGKIDYDIYKCYENAKEEFERFSTNEDYTNFIKKLYQIQHMPFVCVVVSRDCSEIRIEAHHFPIGNLYYGVPPWKFIVPTEIKTLNFENIDIKLTND